MIQNLKDSFAYTHALFSEGSFSSAESQICNFLALPKRIVWLQLKICTYAN